MAEITEVVTKFSFTGSTSPLGQYNEQLGTAIKGLTAFATATYGALAGLTFWADNILKGIDPLAQLSRQTGIGVEAIQELGFASSVTGGSIDAMNGGLERLAERIGEAKALGTGEGVEIFKKLGIDIEDAKGRAKTADAVFDELRQSIVAMDLDEAQATSIAAKLGLDPSAVQLLMKTNAEMAELRERSRELGQLTQEQADQAAEYNDSLTMMNRAMDGLKQEIAVGFAPQMTALTKGFTDFIVVNRELISDIATDGIDILISLAKTFSTVGGALFDMTRRLFDIKPIFYGVIAAAAALSAKLFPYTALVAGIVLVVDDLIVAFNGGESAIAHFFETLTGTDFQHVIDDMKELYEIFNKMMTRGADHFLTTFNVGGYADMQRDAQMQSIKDSVARGNESYYNNITINQTNNADIRTNDIERGVLAYEETLQKQMNDVRAQIGNGGL